MLVTGGGPHVPPFSPHQLQGRSLSVALSDPQQIVPPGGHARGRVAALGPDAKTVSSSRRAEGAGKRSRERLELQDSARALLPNMRIATCLRAPLAPTVSLQYNAEHCAASWANLATCGSVWVCPVCAARIGARRTEEIKAACKIWSERQGYLCMMTLTLRHHKARRLEEIYSNLRAAYRKLLGGERWILFQKRYKIVGYISAREITYGKNGWHPHLHVLFFCKEPLNNDMRQTMADWCGQRWRDELAALGENATQEHGVKVTQTDEEGEDYLTKLSSTWSIGNEIAGINNKSGKQGGLVPAQLLRKYRKGDEKAGYRYQEYAAATFNTNWVSWSPGLRKEIFNDETEETDEQIAAKPEKGAVEIFAFTRYQWFTILEKGLRGQIIELAHENDPGQIAIFVSGEGLTLEEWQYKYTVAFTEELKK